MPKIIDMINNVIHHQLSFGYDVGKGFIVGEEEVSKHIHDMVADKRVARDLKARSEKSRLDVVKSLGKNVSLNSLCSFTEVKDTCTNHCVTNTSVTEMKTHALTTVSPTPQSQR